MASPDLPIGGLAKYLNKAGESRAGQQQGNAFQTHVRLWDSWVRTFRAETKVPSLIIGLGKRNFNRGRAERCDRSGC